MKIVLMVFLKEFCSGPISHSRLTNNTSMWFSQKQQQQQQKATTTCFAQLGYFEPTDGILWLWICPGDIFRLPAMAGRVLWVRSALLSIVFSETLLRGRGLYRDGRDRWIFCEKFPLGKNNKVVKNCRKADFLEFLRKLSHLFCLEMMKNKIMMVLWHS